MSDKQAVLHSLRASFERWEELLSSLSAEQIAAPLLPDRWAIRDVIAHLWAWQQRSVARLAAGLHDREPVFPAWPAELDAEPSGQPHALNAWIYAAQRGRPWPEVHADWRAGFLRLLELGAALPAADLLDAARYPWLEGHTLAFILQASCEHHREHMEYLEPLLPQIRQYTAESAG
jgi:hypothetical protein